MAADLTGSEAGDITRPDVSPVDRPAPTAPNGSRSHRRRFALVYALLALALAAAIVGIVVYSGRALNSGPTWSAWKPSGGGIGAAKKIADHVAPKYRLPDGNQLVDVIARGPSVSGTNGQAIAIPLIAIRGPKGKILPDQIVQTSSDNTLTYSLCGLGQSCSIATGKPSTERATLVRREILELALYTFKYMRGVKHIVAFMPPPAGTQPQFVVYLQKDDLKQQLHNPLTQTIPAKTPLPSQISPREQQRIDSLTLSKIYKFGLSQTQQGDPVLVLQKLNA
ncbi:MAG TPA: hypothetical protein VFA56_12935 [Gaiellaceae bacterium]|nr:hypothetical protein [Gaiellaceae bacterium]